MLKRLWYRYKWKHNTGNIRGRYKTYLRRLVLAKDGDFISVDWDTIYVSSHPEIRGQ